MKNWKQFCFNGFLHSIKTSTFWQYKFSLFYLKFSVEFNELSLIFQKKKKQELTKNGENVFQRLRVKLWYDSKPSVILWIFQVNTKYKFSGCNTKVYPSIWKSPSTNQVFGIRKVSVSAIFDYNWCHGLLLHCDKIVVKCNIHRKIFVVVSIHIPIQTSKHLN